MREPSALWAPPQWPSQLQGPGLQASALLRFSIGTALPSDRQAEAGGGGDGGWEWGSESALQGGGKWWKLTDQHPEVYSCIGSKEGKTTNTVQEFSLALGSHFSHCFAPEPVDG